MNNKRHIWTSFILYYLTLLLVVTQGSAYVPIEEHNGIKYKFYTETYKDYCFDIMNQISPKYLEGIKLIRIYAGGINKQYFGTYTPIISIIDDFSWCSKDTIIHELAHHCQIKRGDTITQAKNHIGHFNECEEEIWRSLK